jgi:hypothetical protein
MSFSKSRAGVGVVVLVVMCMTISRGNAADFDAVQLELPRHGTASGAGFNLNFATTGSSDPFYFDRELLGSQQGYRVDSDAVAATPWEILWQQPALIPVSVVPEPTTATLLVAAAALLARRFRAKRTSSAS